MLAGELGELKSVHLKGAIFEKHFVLVLVFRVIKVITAYLSSVFEKSSGLSSYKHLQTLFYRNWKLSCHYPTALFLWLQNVIMSQKDSGMIQIL